MRAAKPYKRTGRLVAVVRDMTRHSQILLRDAHPGSVLREFLKPYI
jgi:hypothetical protein